MLCFGYEWELSITYVVFGERGSCLIKFFVGVVFGVFLFDIFYLDVCVFVGEVLLVIVKYIWCGGCGVEMGVISSDVAAYWFNVSGASVFDGFFIVILLFVLSVKFE